MTKTKEIDLSEYSQEELRDLSKKVSDTLKEKQENINIPKGF